MAIEDIDARANLSCPKRSYSAGNIWVALMSKSTAVERGYVGCLNVENEPIDEADLDVGFVHDVEYVMVDSLLMRHSHHWYS